jgi:hypothetical protein
LDRASSAVQGGLKRLQRLWFRNVFFQAQKLPKILLAFCIFATLDFDFPISKKDFFCSIAPRDIARTTGIPVFSD